jgi:hypothetical protein
MTQPKTSRLRLSAAELAVLMGALSLDSGPFVESSELVRLNQTHLLRRLTAAREGLILRQLATVQPDDSLAVAPAVRDLILRAVQPQAGFQLFHSQAGRPPQRLYFSVSGPAVVVHALKGEIEHVLEPLAGVSDILTQILDLALPTVPADTPAQPFLVPQQILVNLAATPPRPDSELLPALTAAGLSAAQAAAVLAAGLQPTQQTVLTGLGARDNQVGAGSLLWFANADSAWLMSNFAENSPITLQAATQASISRAVSELVVQATSPLAANA